MEDDAVREQLEVEPDGPGHREGEPRPDGSAEVAHGVEVTGEDAGDRPAGGGRVREVSVLDRVQMELDDVEGALERLDAGSYGTCQTCGGPIDDERLARVPATRFCGEHQSD